MCNATPPPSPGETRGATRFTVPAGSPEETNRRPEPSPGAMTADHLDILGKQADHKTDH